MKTILVYCKFIYKKIVSLGQAIHAVWHDKNNEHLTAVQNPLSKLSTKKYVHQDDKRMHNAAEEVQSKKKQKKPSVQTISITVKITSSPNSDHTARL